jgi:diguanylate cyclase (GGDEF)-like protein
VIDTHSLSVVRPLSRADGQAVTHYWTASGARLSDGTLFFGGQGGVSIVNPDRLGSAPPLTHVRVTNVRIDGQRRAGGSRIVLSPGARGVQVEFSALEYVAPELCRYSYRLEGFDPDWIEVDPQHLVAAYTTLPPGDYRLLVRAARRDEPWTSASLALPLLDHFKRINDQYGHAIGDAALRAAGECLTRTLREVDLGARYGGEELAALLPETDFDGATEAAERFRLALEAVHIAHEDRPIRVTVSIGVSVWRDDEEDIRPALARADAALYRAKNDGRNRVAVA